MRVARLVPLVLVLLLTAGSAATATEASGTRLYLLAADTDYLYWSTDPADPELGVTRVVRNCGATVAGAVTASKPCLQGVSVSEASRSYQLYFAPAALLDAPVAWSAASPLRFHLALDVVTTAPYTVHFLVHAGGVAESSAATQVAPGVWEGVVATGGPIDPAAMALLGVRVKTAAPGATLTLGTAGASWVDLPAPVPARSVPDILAASPRPAERLRYVTPQRRFTFNDARWSVQSFTGDLTQKRTFETTIDHAAIVYAWVEIFDTTLLQDVVAGRTAQTRKLRDGARLALHRDGAELEHGSGGAPGRGMDTLAALDVDAGPLTLEVQPAAVTVAGNRVPAAEGGAFTAYLLVVNGERTLDSMRWRFQQDTASHRTPVSGGCPSNNERVPTTAAVQSFLVDLDWETVAMPAPKFTLRYVLPAGEYPCGEGGTGDRVRFTHPRAWVWFMGATPAVDARHVSYRDTTFEMTVRYAYSPEPPS